MGCTVNGSMWLPVGEIAKLATNVHFQLLEWASNIPAYCHHD